MVGVTVMMGDGSTVVRGSLALEALGGSPPTPPDGLHAEGLDTGRRDARPPRGRLRSAARGNR
jgi:hypothetical protein